MRSCATAWAAWSIGDAASRTAVRAFLDAYERKTPAESIPDALERSVREANNQVVALAHSLGTGGRDRHHAGGRGAEPGVAVLHFGGRQRAVPLHRRRVPDDQPAAYFRELLDAAVARGNMSREDAEQHPERESLTSFIGTEIAGRDRPQRRAVSAEPGRHDSAGQRRDVQDAGPGRNSRVARRASAIVAGLCWWSGRSRRSASIRTT